MPVCSLHLLALKGGIDSFLPVLSKSSTSPLVVARVVRWIILPSTISTVPLLSKNIHWDLLLVLQGSDPLPKSLQDLISEQWTVTAGVPSRIVSSFGETNERLLRPQFGDVPALTGSLDKPKKAKSTQSLELTDELQDWAELFSQETAGKGALSMLNLLAFKPGKKEEYLKYGKAFAESTGSRRGGFAKIVGSVIGCSSTPEGGAQEWHEVALAHYPSIKHFADMLASEDYQEANHKFRVGSLADTFILCTTELDLSSGQSKSKL